MSGGRGCRSFAFSGHDWVRSSSRRRPEVLVTEMNLEAEFHGRGCTDHSAPKGGLVHGSRRGRQAQDFVEQPPAGRVPTDCERARLETMSKSFGTMLLIYGAFLAICGTAGAALHSWEKKAMHSMYAGLGGFVSMAEIMAQLEKDPVVEPPDGPPEEPVLPPPNEIEIPTDGPIGALPAEKRQGEVGLQNASSSYLVPVAIGVHLALVLMLVFIAVFTIQAVKSSREPEKFDRLVLFMVMGVGSAVALAKAISMKPKKEKK
eukprot:s2643_g6.t2